MVCVQKHEDVITSGLSWMSFDTLYKVFKALLASREAACHEVATLLWEVEASVCMTASNQALHQENKTRLNLKDKQLKKIRNYFSEREPTEINNNTDYNQAIYNNEFKILRAITAQAEIISRCLGSRARDSITHALHSGFADAAISAKMMIATGGQASSARVTCSCDISMIVINWYCPASTIQYFALPALAVHRSFSAVHKLPYWTTPPHLFYTLERGPQQKTKAKVPKPLQGSGLNPLGKPATDQLCIPTEQPQMSSFNFDVHAASAGWQGDTDSTPPTQMNTSLHGWSMQDTNFDGHFSHSHSYGTSSLEHDTGFDDHRDMSTLEMASLARETKRRGTRQAMPPTPRMIPYPTTRPQGASKSTLSTAKASTSQTVMSESLIAKSSPMKLTEDIINQTMKAAMKLVTHELFGEQAMSNDKTAKKDMLTQVIWDSIPHCFGPNAMFEDFIYNKHRRDVVNALSVTRGKFAEFTREGVFNTHKLFPPWHSITPPITYRQRVIQKITTDADRLVFMHTHTFNQNGQVEIKAKFQNPFVMSNAICFTWSGSHQKFLGDTEEQQIERLKLGNVMGICNPPWVVGVGT
ncbi:hypothetical protein BDR03DRAFT_977422 [Suillus americanus]|nr:hypothetical protein BDR03DRAFT_977422 [Suillus americanus]